MTERSRSGTLFIVATPLGNLLDITIRAITTLREVDLIACEDTRVTRIIKNKYRIKTPLISYHKYNEKKRAKKIIEELKDGKNIALVSSSGTPTIQDPGNILVDMAIEEGIKVCPIPGPTALVSAISVSGFLKNGFIFLGFLPKKGFRKILSPFISSTLPIVIYESPKRVLKTLRALKEIFGERRIIFARELTKVYEEVIRGEISEIIEILEKRPSIKGELTLVVEGLSKKKEK